MDARDRARIAGNWYESLDESKMTVTVIVWDDQDEETPVDFPMKWEVCELCRGKGSHVNPAIDAHGISGEEMYDDPDFAERYFSGFYDVPCYESHGRRVVPEIDTDRLTDQQKKEYKTVLQNQAEDASYAAQCEAERRMGA